METNEKMMALNDDDLDEIAGGGKGTSPTARKYRTCHRGIRNDEYYIGQVPGVCCMIHGMNYNINKYPDDCQYSYGGICSWFTDVPDELK
jgi:hypothetical protein